MSRSKLPSLKEPVAEIADAQIHDAASGKARRRKNDKAAESVAELTDSKNLAQRCMSQTSVIEDGGAGIESQNNGVVTPSRLKKKPKALVSAQKHVGVPRQTAVKKKGKKRTRRCGPSSGNLGLATELYDLAEDIVGHDAAADGAVLDQTCTEPLSTVAMMKSEPTQKVFTETKSGFKATDRARLAQKRARAAQAVTNLRQDAAQMNTIQFALKTHRCFKTIAIFLQGMFAGITLWHVVSTFGYIGAGLAMFFYMSALPVQCLYFFLFAISTVYALDRYDLASPSRELLVKSLFLQTGAICVVFYFCGLILSLVMASLDEHICLSQITSITNTTETAMSDSDWLSKWKGLNVARAVLVMLGWFVVSLSPHTDYLSKSLLKANDDILQPNTATGKLQATEGYDNLWSTQNT